MAPSISTEKHEAPEVAYVETLDVAEHLCPDLAMAIILSNGLQRMLTIAGVTCWSCGIRTLTTQCLDDKRCPHKCCPRHSCLEKLHCHWVEICAESEAWEQWEERMLMAAHDRGVVTKRCHEAWLTRFAADHQVLTVNDDGSTTTKLVRDSSDKPKSKRALYLPSIAEEAHANGCWVEAATRSDDT